LSDFWNELDDAKIYKSWPLGFIEGIFYKNSIYDSSPISQTLAQLIQKLNDTQKFYRKLSIGVTDLNSGDLLIVRESVGIKRLLKFIEASMIIPGIFTPVAENSSTLLVDGSTTLSLDMISAIEGCREIVENDSDIILDVIMTSEVRNITKDYSNVVGVSMLYRYVFLE